MFVSELDFIFQKVGQCFDVCSNGASFTEEQAKTTSVNECDGVPSLPRGVTRRHLHNLRPEGHATCPCTAGHFGASRQHCANPGAGRLRVSVVRT